MALHNISLQRTAPCGLAAELGSLGGRNTADDNRYACPARPRSRILNRRDTHLNRVASRPPPLFRRWQARSKQWSTSTR